LGAKKAAPKKKTRGFRIVSCLQSAFGVEGEAGWTLLGASYWDKRPQAMLFGMYLSRCWPKAADGVSTTFSSDA